MGVRFVSRRRRSLNDRERRPGRALDPRDRRRRRSLNDREGRPGRSLNDRERRLRRALDDRDGRLRRALDDRDGRLRRWLGGRGYERPRCWTRAPSRRIDSALPSSSIDSNSGGDTRRPLTATRAGP